MKIEKTEVQKDPSEFSVAQELGPNEVNVTLYTSSGLRVFSKVRYLDTSECAISFVSLETVVENGKVMTRTITTKSNCAYIIQEIQKPLSGLALVQTIKKK